MVGVFYSFIGLGIFFLSCIRENKAGVSCRELGELSWILGVFQLWEGANLMKMLKLQCNKLHETWK